MDGQHLHVKPRRGGDRPGDGVRDVVKFQIKEDSRPGFADFIYNPGPAAVNNSLPILKPPTTGANSRDQSQCRFRGRNIQRGNNWVSHRDRAL